MASILFGSEFSVVCQTDHKPLQAFMTQPHLHLDKYVGSHSCLEAQKADDVL